MNDGYVWWLILVGVVITLAVVWVYAARLPRAESDVSLEERRAEAAWISETIERFGGVAPPELVEEVLELHAEYLASPRLARIPDRNVGTLATAMPSAQSVPPQAGPAQRGVRAGPAMPPAPPVGNPSPPLTVRPRGELSRAGREAPPSTPR